ncbi:hypothetical protein [Leuconostoc suionicum]|uniref:hypothetical protein n=1 Tax=Leuconostoc suionicum TaxID=1511761 RepID=UPI0021A64DC0|nr:hypothetical protein [Leuconostoc suionicum]MCT4376838.1 hypothetical protein [Leuconostoc suionicum]
MAITMYTSDRAFVTPREFASAQSALGGDTSGVLKRGNQLKITVNGLTATVDTGQVIILGRLVEVISPTQITLPANSNGNLAIVVDLSKANTVQGQAGQPNYYPTINQVYLGTVTGDLVQEDLNNGGFIYELPLATFSTTATSGTVTQSNPMLNDSGWLNLDIASTGAKLWSDNGNPCYAQYRVRDNVVFLRWRGVDVGKANNGNQIGRSLRPDVEIASASSDIGATSIYPVISYINDTTTLWVKVVDNHNGNLVGSMSYPLPVGR